MDTKTEIDVNNFVKWVSLQPKKMKYDYQSAYNCPIAQYFKSRYCDSDVIVLHDKFMINTGFIKIIGVVPLHLARCIASQKNISGATDETGDGWTFGGLCDRLCEAYH